MASVRQVDQARAQATNMLANVSTVGFKESYRHATESVKVASTAFSTTYQPVAASEDFISLRAGPMQSTGRQSPTDAPDIRDDANPCRASGNRDG